jgi:hypothetical protein
LLPTYTDWGNANALVPFAIGALALMLYILFHPGVRSARLERSRPAAVAATPGVVDFEEARRRRA